MTAIPPVSVDPRLHQCEARVAAQWTNWIASRGGIAVWQTLGPVYPPARCYWPLLSLDGLPCSAPRADVGDTPAEIITDPARVEVVTYRAFERFVVGVRHGAQRLSLRVDEDGRRRIDEALERARREGHVDVMHEFDYQTHEVVILVPDVVMTLSTFLSR
jgi:hypothetical protein